MFTLALALLAPAAPDDVKACVEKGLKWLAAQQKPDGSWALTNYVAPTRITVLAGLALLMEGSTLETGTYAPNLRKALEWLEKNAAATKILGKDRAAQDTVTRDHAHAILFLVCAHDSDEDAGRQARVAKLINQALDDAVKAQSRRGGWGTYLASGALFDDSCEWTADMLHALFVARRAGFEVPRKVTDAGLAYLEKATNRDGGVVASHNDGTPAAGTRPATGDTHRMSTYSAAAVGMTADRARPDALPQWLRVTLTSSPKQMGDFRAGTQIFLQQLHAAHACYALGDQGHRKIDSKAPEEKLFKWSEYRAKLFKALKDSQDEAGAWSDPTHGKTYPTALALIMLQLDNGYLPAFPR